MPSAQHGALTDALGAARLDGSAERVLDVLERFVKRPPQSAGFSPSLKAFGENSVPEILRALDNDGSEWAQKQAASIRAKSPFAMAASFEAVRQGAKLDFKSAMNQELFLSMGFAKTQDFYEGIRAQLIDKDRSPKWQHDDVSAVTASQVARVFRPAGKPLKFLP